MICRITDSVRGPSFAIRLAMKRERTGTSRLPNAGGELETTLIDGFLRSHGVDPGALAALPERYRQKLLTEASVYASGKLMEVEARSHYLEQIHDDATLAALAPSHRTPR